MKPLAALVIFAGLFAFGCAKLPAPSPAADAGVAGAAVQLAERVLNASPYEIAVDAKLQAYATATAEKAIQEHCAACHGADLTGKPGIPNLVDGDWLWGVGNNDQNDVAPVMAIQQTLLYGIRNKTCAPGVAKDPYGSCPDTRYSEMPGFQTAGVLSARQVDDLTEYVIKISGGKADAAAAARGKRDWKVCTECHGADGRGFVPYGGPNLTDAIWLYGGDRESIRASIANGRSGVCPPWGKVLDAASIKALAVYIFKKSQDQQ